MAMEEPPHPGLSIRYDGLEPLELLHEFRSIRGPLSPAW